jgi:hypothetical protein
VVVAVLVALTIAAATRPAVDVMLFGGLLVLPFGAPFWSADAVFAELGSRIPAPSAESPVERTLLFATVLVGALGLALSARDRPPARERSDHRRLTTPGVGDNLARSRARDLRGL